jgi:hypothetical protein
MSTKFMPAAALAVATLAFGIARPAPVLAQEAQPDAAKTPTETQVAQPPDTGKLHTVIAAQKGADQAAVTAQGKIDEINDETQEMVAKYRQALVDTESFRRYADQLAVQVKAQEEELGSIERQLAEIESTQRDVLPLMEEMVVRLEEFVKLDVPFLAEERNKRVAGLKEILTRADVTVSEKYRRILEAYQIEMEYGRTLDSYKGEIGEGGDKRTVEFVRLGRVALIYQTLDGNETGYWDQDKREWVRDDSYRSQVKAALSVAKKEGAPDLLEIPVPSPKEVKS